MKLETLLQLLEPQIRYLASSTKIPGMERADIEQELRLVVIKDYNKYFSELYCAGWWFKRLKWHAINLFNKEKKEPVNRANRRPMETANGK